jgi:autotransporter-associated beta strand protein
MIMKNLTSNPFRIIPAALGLWLLAGLLACPSPATAQSYWDAAGLKASPGGGGTGTWNAGNANWWVSGSSDTTWTANNIAYFEGTVGTVTLGDSETADGLTFNPTAGTGTYTISGTGTLTLGGATPTITMLLQSNVTINCVLAGTAGLTIGITGTSGTGTSSTLTLGSANNTYTGGTTIGPGAYVQIGSSDGASYGCLGAITSPLTLNSGTGVNHNTGLRWTAAGLSLSSSRNIILGPNGGCINAPSGDTETINGVISGTQGGAIEFGANYNTGTGTNVLTAANTYNGATIVAAGRLKLGTGGSLPSGTALTIGRDTAAGAFFDMGGNSQTIGPLASSTGIGATGSGIPTIVLSGALTVNEGSSSTTFAGDLVAASGYTGSLTVNGSSGGTLTLSGGTNTYTGTTTIGSGAKLTLGGAAVLGETSAGVGSYAANITDNGTFTYGSTAAQTLTGTISGSGALLVNNPAAILTLSGTESYTGATTISPGTLLVNGSLASGSAVTVGAGGTLGGSGTINGTVTVSGGGILAPGGVNNIGKLALANTLTLNEALLLFDLNNNGTAGSTYDQIANTGSLVLNGANYIELNSPGGTINSGAYTLMTYASMSGSGTLTFPNGSATMGNFTLTVGATSVTLSVSANTSGPLTWKGNVNGSWDTTDENWVYGTTPAYYSDGDNVIFNDTASGNFTITNTSGTVTPGAVTFNNSANNYGMAVPIAGASTPLYKFGSAILTLSASNTYAGGTTIGGGYLYIGSDSNLGATNCTLTLNCGTLSAGLRANNALTLNTNRGITLGANGGSINVASGCTLTNPCVISGTGNLQFGGNFDTGVGTNLLSGANTYSGTTTIAAGRLLLGASGTLPDGTPLTVATDNAGGTFFDLGGFSQTIGPLASAGGIGGTPSPAGTPTIVLSGALTVNETNSTTFAGQIIDGPTPGSGSFTLSSLSTGTLTLTKANTYTGATAVNGGTLALGAANALSASAVTVASGATLSNANTTASTIGGTTTLNSGAYASFTGVGGVSSAVGEISVTGDLALNANVITVNVTGSSALAAGSYPLMNCTGTLSGSAYATPTITGTPLAGGYTASVSTTTGSGGHVDLIVTSAVLSTTNAIQSIVNNGNGTLTLTMQGTPSAKYYVVTSANVAAPLSTWTPVVGSTNVADSVTGLWNFIVTDTSPAAFYTSVAMNPAP